MGNRFAAEIVRIRSWKGMRASGRVTQVIGLLIESHGPEVAIGEVCYIYGKQTDPVPCEVVGFKKDRVLLLSLGEIGQIAPGAEVYPFGAPHRVAVGNTLKGRVLDAIGRPIDGKGRLLAENFYPVTAPPPQPLMRKKIDKRFDTKIKGIDALCTLGRGQRVGIFSAPGVGKSTLMGMIAKSAKSDINVIALIGERGREIKEFIENELGPQGLSKSVIIAATSDQAALLRSKGANVAMAIAEYFRDQGLEVLLMMDSVSRYATALREVGLAIGEPPTTRGYTPSVFAALPRLLERAGNSEKGSITGIYTILDEGSENDPIPEQMLSLLDGHLYLSRELASANHFPPIDFLKSLSRLMPSITTLSHQQLAKKLRSLQHIYREAEELIHLGAYLKGSNPKIDEAVTKIDQIKIFLQQEACEAVPFQETLEYLEKVT